MLNKVKELVGVELNENIQEDVNLAQATLENGTVIESDDFAVGSEVFVNQVADSIDPELSKRKTTIMGESFAVRQAPVAYNAHSDGKMGPLRPPNTVFWNVSL